MKSTTRTAAEAIELQSLPAREGNRAPSVQGPDETQDTPAADQEYYPSGLRFIFITCGLILSIFLAALDTNILSTAIPKITDQFEAVKDVGWYSTGYAITNTAFTTCWGKAYKYFPLKWTFIAAVCFFELGNVICGAAQSSSILILGRLVSGVGGGGIFTGCFIIIALSSRPQYRAAYMGIVGVTFGTASVAGPLIGGFLTDGPGWRWCFWINLPIGAFAAGILTLSFKSPPATFSMGAPLREKLIALDLGGAGLVLGSITCFVLALERAGLMSPWSDWRVIISLVSSVALLILFLFNERMMKERAMVQSHLLKKGNIASTLVYQFFLAGLFFPLSYALPIQFQSVGNASATQSGLRLMPLLLGVCVFTMITNGILTFWRHYTPLFLAGAIFGTVGVALVHTLDANARLASWIGYELLIALGVGITLQVPMIANQASVGSDDIAAVTSLTLFVENVGTSIFIPSTVAAFSNGLVNSLAKNAPGVDSESVLHVGVTKIRTAFSSDEVRGILKSYLQGCQDSHLIPLACGASAIVVSMIVAVPAAKKQVGSLVRKGT